MANAYEEYGYKDREDYLRSLAEDHDVDYGAVLSLAELLGESEDFDGLVSEVSEL